MHCTLDLIAVYLFNKTEIRINYLLSSQRLNCSVINVPTHKTNPFDTPLINASDLVDCQGESNTGNVCGKKSVNIHRNWRYTKNCRKTRLIKYNHYTAI